MIYRFRAIHPISGIKYFEMTNIDAGSLLFDNGNWRPIIECEIEQFTGCFDKNDKELYFNDIIEIKEHYDGDFIIPSMQYQIIWDAPFFVALNDQKASCEEIDETKKVYITLLGNIHEGQFKKW